MTIKDQMNGVENELLFKQNSTQRRLECGVKKHGQAEWQGNKFRPKAVSRRSSDHEVNKKCKLLLPQNID